MFGSPSFLCCRVSFPSVKLTASCGTGSREACKGGKVPSVSYGCSYDLGGWCQQRVLDGYQGGDWFPYSTYTTQVEARSHFGRLIGPFPGANLAFNSACLRNILDDSGVSRTPLFLRSCISCWYDWSCFSVKPCSPPTCLFPKRDWCCL